MPSTTTASATTASFLASNDSVDWKRHANSAFLAGDVVIEVVPSFSTSQKMELLSIPSLGPWTAGVATEMPLWLALMLEKRNLCKIIMPEWMSLENLQSILQWEQTQEQFSPSLPYYWQPISHSLSQKSDAQRILLQDISQVRMDKIRRNLHTLSKQSLQQEQTLPIVNVTGIGALELAAIYSFVQESFGMHLKLSRPSSTNSDGDRKSASETRKSAMASTSTSGGGGDDGSDDDDDDDDSDSNDEDTQPPSAKAPPSRLRRFR